MTQDEKRIAFHKLIDNVFDSGEVFDWVGGVEIGARGSNKPSWHLLIFNPETSSEKAVDILTTGALEVHGSGLIPNAENGGLYNWRDGSKMEWGKFKP